MEDISTECVREIWTVFQAGGTDDATVSAVKTLHRFFSCSAFGMLALVGVAHAQALNGVNGPVAVPDSGSSVLLLSAGAVGALLVVRRFLKK